MKQQSIIHLRMLLLLTITWVADPVFGQETNLKINKLINYIEEYYVLKSDKKIKHGSYVKYHIGYLIGDKGGLLESGQFYMNEKDGIWKKYSINQVSEVASYNKGKLEGEYYNYYIDTAIRFNSTVKDNNTLLIDIDDENVKTRIFGHYHSNVKTGIWNYFDGKGDIIFQYNYDDNLLLIDKTDSVLNSKSQEDSLHYPNPVYIGGGKPGLEFELLAIFELFPKMYSYLKKDNKIILKFSIRQNGKLEKIEVNESPFFRNLEKKIVEKIKLSDDWIITKSHGNEMYSYILSINFKLVGNYLFIKME